MHKLRIYISYKILIFKKRKKNFFSFKELVIDRRKACLNKWNASEIRRSP